MFFSRRQGLDRGQIRIGRNPWGQLNEPGLAQACPHGAPLFPYLDKKKPRTNWKRKESLSKENKNMEESPYSL
jgi:hypothetical protein